MNLRGSCLGSVWPAFALASALVAGNAAAGPGGGSGHPGPRGGSGHPGPRGPAVFDEQSFRLPATLVEPAGTSSTGVNLVDVDGDGDLDVFLAEGTASIDPRPNILLVNDGHGVFTDESAARLPQGQDANSAKAAFADLDGDGDLDAIVANLGPEQLLLNDGTGHFADASTQLPPPPNLFSDISAGVHLADLTGDGCPDALIANENPFDPDPTHGAQNWLWVNDCHGHFTDETAARLPALTDQTAGHLTGDLDGDGDPDIIVLERGQDRALINQGGGVFVDETAARLPAVDDSTRGGALADLDRDGSLDLITSNSRGQVPRLYLNDGHGVFVERAIPYVEAPDQTDVELLLIDLNGDRFPDVYIGNAGRFDAGHGFEGGPDHFFENHHGHLREATARHATFPVDQASTAAGVGDLDGDGDEDLFVAGTGDGALGRERVFIQRGRGRGPCRD